MRRENRCGFRSARRVGRRGQGGPAFATLAGTLGYLFLENFDARLHLDAERPFAELEAADEKSREGNSIALRGDLADDIRSWLASKLSRQRDDARQAGDPIP